MNQKWHKWVRGAQIKRSKTAAKCEKGRPKIYTYEVFEKPIRQTNYKLQILIGVNWIGQLNERNRGGKKKPFRFPPLSNTLTDDEGDAVNHVKTSGSLTESQNVRVKGFQINHLTPSFVKWGH